MLHRKRECRFGALAVSIVACGLGWGDVVIHSIFLFDWFV